MTVHLSAVREPVPIPESDQDRERREARRADLAQRMDDGHPLDGDEVAAVLPPTRPGPYAARTVAYDFPVRRDLPGVRVVDPTAGITYEVATDDDGRIVALTVLPHDGTVLGRLTTATLDALADVAHTWGAGRWGVARFGSVERPAVARPSHQVLADAYRQARAHPEPRGGPDVRHVLAAMFHASPNTIDKWLRDARRARALEPSKRGRPRRPTTERNTP